MTFSNLLKTTWNSKDIRYLIPYFRLFLLRQEMKPSYTRVKFRYFQATTTKP